MLAATAVHVCIAEGASLGLFTIQQILLPISSEDTRIPIPLQTTLYVFELSVVVEFFGDMMTAWTSFALCRRWPHIFLDVASGRRELHLCSVSGLVPLAVVSLVSAEFVSIYLSSLCVASNPSFRVVIGRCPFRF